MMVRPTPAAPAQTLPTSDTAYCLCSQGRGREAHVPLMTKIKRTFGIRSTPRRERERERYDRRTLRRRDRY